MLKMQTFMFLAWATSIVLYDTASKVQKQNFTAMDFRRVVIPLCHPCCPKNSPHLDSILISNHLPLALYSDGVIPNLPTNRR